MMLKHLRIEWPGDQMGDERLGGGGCFLGKTIVCMKPTAKRMLSSAGEWSPNGDAD